MDNLPLGTILTVPKDITVVGYKDYLTYLEEGNTGSIEPVKVGNLRFDLFGTETGSWKEWNSVGHISQYPELKCYLFHFYQSFPLDSPERKVWEDTYNMGFLPDISNRFFKVSSTGGVFDIGSIGAMYHFPVIEHTENLMRPIGQTLHEDPKDLYSPIVAQNVTVTDVPANLVLLGQRPSVHTLKEPANLIQSGNDVVGHPANMSVRVMINTETHIPGIPNTHKLMIKVG